MATARTYLDLTVGPYRLALHHVFSVVADPQPNRLGELAIEGAVVPYRDLRAIFGGTRSGPTPYAIVLDPPAPLPRVAVGVDAVGHLQGAARHPGAIPPLGLYRPTLFSGAARAEGRLLLLVDAAELTRLLVGEGAEEGDR